MLLAFISAQAIPEGSVIEVGQEVVGEVEAGWVVEYFLQAKAGDYVMGVVIGQGPKLLVEVEDPSLGDSPLFGEDAYKNVIPFCFHAPKDGTYPIRIHSESTKPSPYTLFVGFREHLGETAIGRAKKFFSLQPPSLPGSTMAVIQNGEIQMLEARGTVGEGSADSLTLQTAFDCPDLLLPFLESALLQLRIENKSRRASGIHEHLPWFPAYNPPVTVKQVIHATSGFPSIESLYELKKWDPLAKVSPEEARKILSKEQLRDNKWSSLPSVRTTPTDFARWMAALQSLQLEETNGMMYLHQMDAIPDIFQGSKWSLLVKPADTWAALQMNVEGSMLRQLLFLSLKTALDEPWPWITPGFDVGLGGGRLGEPISYKVKADSPRLGRFRCEGLDLEIEIQCKDDRLLLVGPDGKGMPVDRTRGGDWRVRGDFYLSLKFNLVKEGRIDRLVIQRTDARAEFRRMQEPSSGF